MCFLGLGLLVCVCFCGFLGGVGLNARGFSVGCDLVVLIAGLCGLV